MCLSRSYVRKVADRLVSPTLLLAALSHRSAHFNPLSSITCRQRKLKCDEQRPTCGQCKKAERKCVPSSGIVFRHQQNASMNHSRSQEAESLQAFYSYKNTFDRHSVWVKIPKKGTAERTGFIRTCVTADRRQ